MKKTILLSVLAMLCLFVKVHGQNTLHELREGEEVPPLYFTKLINTKSTTISTAEYTNQLLIIDFWSTWCSSCIRMFETVEQLQHSYNGKVKFLAVNGKGADSEQKIRAFLGRHPEFHFPTVWDDTTLVKLFPHQSLPHYVWIKNNKVLATTGAEAINADTITAVLISSYRPGNKITRTIDLTRPIFLAGNGGEPYSYLYRSILTPYTPGLNAVINRGADEHGMVSRLLFVNSTVRNLLSAAYPFMSQVAANRTMTGDGVDTGLLRDSTSYAWQAKHRFTYEAMFPPRTPAEAQLIMQQDLGRYFRLVVDSTVTERECLVFSKKLKQDQTSHINEAKPETNWYTAEVDQPITFSNYPLSEAIQMFDEASALPVLNETRKDLRINLQLKKAAVDEQELRTALNKQGILLTRAKRRITMYVIKKADLAHNNP